MLFSDNSVTECQTAPNAVPLDKRTEFWQADFLNLITGRMGEIVVLLYILYSNYNCRLMNEKKRNIPSILTEILIGLLQQQQEML